jgi:hypothetical protein
MRANVPKPYKKHFITSDFDHNRSTASSANMSWRDIVTNWLLTQQENLAILDLLRHLIQANMIPSTLIDNSTLHSIMLTQVMLETLNGVRGKSASLIGMKQRESMNLMLSI